MKVVKSSFETRQPRGAMPITAVVDLAGGFAFGVLPELFEEKLTNEGADSLSE